MNTANSNKSGDVSRTLRRLTRILVVCVMALLLIGNLDSVQAQRWGRGGGGGSFGGGRSFGGGGGSYGFVGGNPVGFGGGDSAGDKSPDAGMNDSSDWGSYAGMFGAVNTGAGHAGAVATTLASFIPLEGLREVIAGNDAMGKKISGMDRAVQAASLGLPLLHGAAPLLKEIKGLDGLARDVNKAREATEATKDVAKAAKGGTYKFVDKETGEVVRTGRTNDLKRRAGEHQRDPKLSGYKFEVDRKTDSYAAQRGREQIIHDQYKPRLNKIEPISRRNPRRGGYLEDGGKL